MKKISNINFGGRIILIEDNAFGCLCVYMDGLKNYFKQQESGYEILNDIEGRIGELMYQEAGNIVSREAVEAIIQCMGSTNDFEKMLNETAEEVLPVSNYSLRNAYLYNATA